MPSGTVSWTVFKVLSTEPVTGGVNWFKPNEVKVAAFESGLTLVDESEALEFPAALVATTVNV